MKAIDKKTETKKAVKTVKNLTSKEVVQALANVKKPSEYTLQVLETNKKFKEAYRNTGKAIKLLLASECLNSKQVAFFKKLQKNDLEYNRFDATVRRTKKNEITPFFVLQAMFKAMK